MKRTHLVLAALFALVSTSAFAQFRDSWTDLEPRVRAAEQASFANATPSMQSEAARAKFDQIDRNSPL
jgi:hypothetical protein